MNDPAIALFLTGGGFLGNPCSNQLVSSSSSPVFQQHRGASGIPSCFQCGNADQRGRETVSRTTKEELLLETSRS